MLDKFLPVSEDSSTTALVEACRRQDEAAWALLVQRYQRLIYSIALQSGLDSDRAADVFQRTFLLLIEQIEQIEQPERLGAWLATTARRESWRMVQRIRRNDQSLQADADEPVNEPVDPQLPLDEQIAAIERRAAVRDAVRSLDGRCRDLLTALFLTTNPPAYAALAEQLGISEGSIGPTRARCLNKLRLLLEER